MSTTKSFIINICPSGETIVALVKSLSKEEIQAKVCNPLQFTLQDPHIPSLQDLRIDKLLSRLSLIYKIASKNIGANLVISK